MVGKMHKQLLLLICVISLSACTGNRSSIDAHDQSARIDQNVTSSYKAADSETEEYVSRIAKRVAMVSDRPNSNYNIEVLDTSDPILEINRESNTVIISNGVLSNLRDEAQLAAALTMGMARLENSPNIDRETAVYLSRAGYDPYAMLDLQEQYFYAAQHGQQHWLHNLYPSAPSAGTIAANRVMLQKLPKGLARDTDSYKNIDEEEH
jgi:predicted Zn-dependent protease